MRNVSKNSYSALMQNTLCILLFVKPLARNFHLSKNNTEYPPAVFASSVNKILPTLPFPTERPTDRIFFFLFFHWIFSLPIWCPNLCGPLLLIELAKVDRSSSSFFLDLPAYTLVCGGLEMFFRFWWLGKRDRNVVLCFGFVPFCCVRKVFDWCVKLVQQNWSSRYAEYYVAKTK